MNSTKLLSERPMVLQRRPQQKHQQSSVFCLMCVHYTYTLCNLPHCVVLWSWTLDWHWDTGTCLLVVDTTSICICYCWLRTDSIIKSCISLCCLLRIQCCMYFSLSTTSKLIISILAHNYRPLEYNAANELPVCLHIVPSYVFCMYISLS